MLSNLQYIIYHLWPHSVTLCLECGRLRVRFPAESAPICSVQVVVRPCPVKDGDNGGQLNLPSLTSLSVAGCGRLQLGVSHLATSIALLQVVDN